MRTYNLTMYIAQLLGNEAVSVLQSDISVYIVDNSKETMVSQAFSPALVVVLKHDNSEH